MNLSVYLVIYLYDMAAVHGWGQHPRLGFDKECSHGFIILDYGLTSQRLVVTLLILRVFGRVLHIPIPLETKASSLSLKTEIETCTNGRLCNDSRPCCACRCV